ncbi:MAG: DegT/DnrJ/EryC1/StrS family aminotransferase [Candidatus Omnitrophica bacterium]|nr:DegT/DnrJ/EryC1/StrS family aminotransferase [Candidatus Omnitrophota bacterium]
MVVHAFGQTADMDPIMKIAQAHRLKVIEDAACALGAGYRNLPAGSIGDIAAVSFHARKNITCGEGGAVLTNNQKYADRVRSLSCFGIKPAYQRQHKFEIPSFRSLGYNYKLSDINAAIVIAQLKRYPSLTKRRLALVKIYDTLLKECPYLTVPFHPKAAFHVYQTYAVVLKPAIDRNKLILSLREEGVETQIGTYSACIQPVYHSTDRCPRSLYLYRHSLALPLYPGLAENDVKTVAHKLKEHIYRQVKRK